MKTAKAYKCSWVPGHNTPYDPEEQELLALPE